MSNPRLLDAEESNLYRTRVVLLGTGGGPNRWPGVDRAGTSTAIVTQGRVYLIDCGEGWGRRFRQANLGPTGYQEGIDDLRAVFITHMHSDHTIDYPNLLVMAWHNGSNGLDQPIQVFGPGDRKILPPIFEAEKRSVMPKVFSPQSPTPGIKEATERILEGYASDINDRMRDNAKQDLDEIFKVQDIELPQGIGNDPNGDPSPEMEPFEIYKDDAVTVTAILVDHRPVFPAFAFRFDTVDGSIVISGDTAACPNLIKLAQEADLLIHECIDMDWVEKTIGSGAAIPDPNLVQHMLAAHTPIEEVGPLADAANAKMLVLNHLAPPSTPVSKWQKAGDGFSGAFHVGEDLMEIGLGNPVSPTDREPAPSNMSVS